ncbi:MAG TPA: glutaredoxin family protein [Solirubrobacteraceae bacterium]|nr:glutaredoxin family protein [Solirubrobacteraceae bacterium]
MSAPEVVLYGRDGCCLCDEARAILERVRARRPFTLVERDIDADEGLLRAYLERIPVVAIDGVEAFEFFVDESEFERRLGDRPVGLPTTLRASDGSG